MIPRLGERPDPTHSYTLRPGAYVILPRQGRVLMTVQWEDVPDIQFPGGGIDRGENTRPALYREVLEETGWTIGPPRRIGAYRRFVFMPEYDLWAEKLCSVYVARPARWVGPPLEADHTALWIPFSDVGDALGNDCDRAFFRRYAGLIDPE